MVSEAQEDRETCLQQLSIGQQRLVSGTQPEDIEARLASGSRDWFQRLRTILGLKVAVWFDTGGLISAVMPVYHHPRGQYMRYSGLPQDIGSVFTSLPRIPSELVVRKEGFKHSCDFRVRRCAVQCADFLYTASTIIQQYPYRLQCPSTATS